MACFAVPAAEAVITTVTQLVVRSQEKKTEAKEAESGEKALTVRSEKTPFSRKLGWLNRLLFGGSFLLLFEHIWHGEVVPFFPFLTAASNPEDAAEMLHEMETSGVGMAVIVTLFWLGMLGISALAERRNRAARRVKKEGSV